MQLAEFRAERGKEHSKTQFVYNFQVAKNPTAERDQI